MPKIPKCPYCNSDITSVPNRTTMVCGKCGSTIRIHAGSLYKSEEMPPEVSCCFVGLFANIARTHDNPNQNFIKFVEDFLRKQNLTKKQYEYLMRMYQKESRKGFSFGHESNKNYIYRLKVVIDDICSSMPLSEQEAYEDSVLRMIINYMKSGGDVTEEQKKVMDLYKNIFGISESRYSNVYNPEAEARAKEKKVEKKPKTVDQIFNEIQKDLLSKISKEKLVSELVISFKRPFLIKKQDAHLKNIVSIHSNENVVMSELANNIVDKMREEGITKSDVKIFDFVMYKREDSLGSFVGAYVEARNVGFEYFIFQNFGMISESCKLFLQNLCKFGRVDLNTPKGPVEVTTQNEFWIFMTEKTPNEFEAIIGSEIFSCINDCIIVDNFTTEEINEMIIITLEKLKKDCKKSLNLKLEYSAEFQNYMLANYNASHGLNSVNMLVTNRIFNPLSELKLKGKINSKELIILTLDANDKFCITFGADIIYLNDEADDRKTNKLMMVKAKLQNIIGLEEVKEYLYKMEDNITAQKMREKAGMKLAPLPLNMIFTGNPGTGKTTVARIVGEYFNALGMLEKGHFVEAIRADLVGSHPGETAEKTRAKVNEALGGVLFIDEAYSLFHSSNDDYGKEALETLVKIIEDNRENLVVILAGYKDEMDDMMRAQSAIRSRFPNIINFEDYTAEEMYKIAEMHAAQNQYKIAIECYEPLIEYFGSKIFKGKNPNGNGRLVRNVIETAMTNQAVRIVKENEADYATLKLIDFKLETKEDFDLEAELSKIIGLKNVKDFLRNQYNILKAQEKRRQVGLTADVTQSLNMIFMGNPGTGKTTVARIVAEMLKEMGFLRSGQLIEVARADLVAEYVGQTAQKTTKVFEDALGGVLFIDEAYSLSKGGESDFGKEAIDTLIKLMEDHRGEIVVILAGYKKEMGDFLKANSGLESRFPLQLAFPDYSPEELIQIFDKMISTRGFKILDEARELAAEKLAFMKKTEITNSGNGRMVRNLIDEIIRNQSTRVAMATDIAINDMNLIISEDIGKKYETENSEYDYETTFDNIIGLESVKQYIRTLAARIKITNERKKLGMTVSDEQSMHMIFKGNPGTGKTMMARAVANMLYKLGVITTDKLVETDRAGLVAGYVGQTAMKTTEKVKEAFNGVLFIDEAYSLSQGGNSDFGKEAIDTLIKLMDDNRDKLVVILAGYSKEMQEFLDVNSGLMSRFPNVIEFEDYTVDELIIIAKKMYEKNGYNITDEAIEKLKIILEDAKKDVRFGNGRFVRNVFERSLNNQALRLASAGMMDKESLLNIMPEDLD